MQKIKILSPSQKKQIDNLWNAEYPNNLNNRFEIFLSDITNANHYLLKNTENNILGWAVNFEREMEQWFSIIVDSQHQGKGYGNLLMKSLKSNINELNGWVIDHNKNVKTNGEIYQSPLAFYLKNGFKVISEERIESEIISAVKIKWTNH